MEFKVKFQSYTGYAIDTPTGTGFDGVELIREVLDDPDFPIENIHNYALNTKQNPEIKLSLEQAKRLWYFNRNNDVIVTVLEGFLNRYTVRLVRVGENTSDAGKTAWIDYQIKEQVLIQEWIKAGAPLRWGI